MMKNIGDMEYLWEKKKKPKIKYVGWQHTRVDKNKNKAQASRFCSTAFHHSSVDVNEVI